MLPGAWRSHAHEVHSGQECVKDAGGDRFADIMPAVRSDSEPSRVRPVGGMGYVVLEFADQFSGKGERLRQDTPWLSWVPQTCLTLQLWLTAV